MTLKKTLVAVFFVCLGVVLPLRVYGSHGVYENDHEHSLNDENIWEEDITKSESVHDHSSPHGGQVGMSGSLHIEFAAKEDGEYRIYITDFDRIPIDISKATGTLIINSESSHSEKLALSLDKILQEYLWAKGKLREQGDTIEASMEVEIPGRKKIIQGFYIEINHSSMEHKMDDEEKNNGQHIH